MISPFSPNPANGQIIVILSSASPTALLRITNVIGAVVREVPVSGSWVSITVADSPAGVYMVQHIKKGAVQAAERMVVQR